MLSKLLSLGVTSLFGLALATAFPPAPPDDDPPPPKAKKKGEPGPRDGLQKAYDLLRQVRGDNRTTGRPEERLRDWTERATALYREGVKAQKAGDPQKAHEYGIAAHDLARAVEHARNAAQFDRSEPDPDLPPPPPPPSGNPAREEDRARAVSDLRDAYDHIRDQLDKDDPGKDAKFYNDAARDLYNAARRDAESGRNDRAAELARAAEALSHVNEHLAHASGNRPEPPDDRDEAKTKPEPKVKKGDRPEKKKRLEAKEKEKEKTKKGEDRPEPKAERPGDALPPPL